MGRQLGRDTPSILHADMDSFFVSVELLERPELVGVPTAVAHDSARSVISSASYEARRFGVSSAMPVARAFALCPGLRLLEPHFEKYRHYSRRVMDIFREFTPLVEPLSIDEAFLDVAGSVRLFGSPQQIAAQIRERVRDELRLPVSVGLGATKHVAKLASARAKPDGVFVVPPERTLEFLHSLPVEAIWGVGKATAQALHDRAIHTVADLSREPLSSLSRIVGQANAERLHELSNGRDAREVQISRTEKSIGHEETFAQDVGSREVLDRELLRLSTRVGERLRAKGLEARVVSIKVRFANFDTITRSRTLAEATDATQRVFLTAQELFAEHCVGADGCTVRPVRLIGVRTEDLHPSGSGRVGLWSDDERWRSLDQAADRVREKFGDSGITPARLLGQPQQRVDPRSMQEPL